MYFYIFFYILFYGGRWVFLIIFYEKEKSERVGEINILINRWDK